MTTTTIKLSTTAITTSTNTVTTIVSTLTSDLKSPIDLPTTRITTTSTTNYSTIEQFSSSSTQLATSSTLSTGMYKPCSKWCPEEDFRNSLSIVGNPVYIIDVNCKQNLMNQRLKYLRRAPKDPKGTTDMWQVTCYDVAGHLPNITHTVSLKVNRSMNDCLRPRTVQCGKINLTSTVVVSTLTTVLTANTTTTSISTQSTTTALPTQTTTAIKPTNTTLLAIQSTTLPTSTNRSQTTTVTITEKTPQSTIPLTVPPKTYVATTSSPTYSTTKADITSPITSKALTTTAVPTAEYRPCSKWCSEKDFLKSLSNMGNPDYSIDVYCRQHFITPRRLDLEIDIKESQKMIDLWTINCYDSLKHLPNITHTVSIKAKKAKNQCRRPRTIQCGEPRIQVTEPGFPNYEGECQCGSHNIYNKLINKSLKPSEITVRCNRKINSKKEQWEIFCNGISQGVSKFKACQPKNSVIYCGNEDEHNSKVNPCGLKIIDVLAQVRTNRKNMTRVQCSAHNGKYDTWTVYCDVNRNSLRDDAEVAAVYTFRANMKKAKKAKMSIICP